jgi:1,2-phenylacetyl-CoA epoxidase catalytic subunit
MNQPIPGHDMQPTATAGSPLRMYKRSDPEMPEDYRRFMVKLLKHAHVENNANPHYRVVLANIAYGGLRHAPDGRAMAIEAEIVKQEVAHGQIVADVIASLGADPFNPDWVGQYAFELPLDCWCDVAWFHMLIDRVGLYVGIEWMGATYEPLAKVSEQLEKDEYFHASSGLRHMKKIVRTSEGRKQAGDLLHKWWPAALDMFGRSDSKNSQHYVRWGIKAHSNAELRQRYIEDTVPLIEQMQLEVPDHNANRRYL